MLPSSNINSGIILAIMADFKLDIDYPYDPPTPDILTEKPNMFHIRQNRIKYKHYGYIMESLIKKASEIELKMKKKKF